MQRTLDPHTTPAERFERKSSGDSQRRAVPWSVSASCRPRIWGDTLSVSSE